MECLVGKWFGLPDISVKEAKERVKTAIKNSGYEMLSKRIVINLAPADTKKEGSIFDLPIAVGILADLGEIKNNNLHDMAFIGELSLDGKINRINGILPMCIELEQIIRQKVVRDDRYTVKFRTSVLKRMSDQTRISMQTSYAQNGLRTRNELRREDGYKWIDGADELTAQNNLYPLDKLGESDASQTPQTPISEQPIKQ